MNKFLFQSTGQNLHICSSGSLSPQKNTEMPNFSLIFSILSPAHFEWEVNFSFKSNDEDRQMVSFIKKKTDKHLFCKSFWAHAVSSDLQEKSC